MFDNLRKFLVKQASAPDLQVDKRKKENWINWDVVGSDLQKLLKTLGERKRAFF